MRCIILITLLWLVPVVGFAATYQVPGDFTGIQLAIDSLVDGDTLVVGPGTYQENIDFLGKAITVKSLQGPGSTVIDGGYADTVVTFRNSEWLGSVLDGFTLRNGLGVYDYLIGARTGGGICCVGSSPTLVNNIITDNTAHLTQKIDHSLN